MGCVLKALGFMTVLPVGESARDVTREDAPAMLACFPLAGVVVGLFGAAAFAAVFWPRRSRRWRR